MRVKSNVQNILFFDIKEFLTIPYTSGWYDEEKNTVNENNIIPENIIIDDNTNTVNNVNTDANQNNIPESNVQNNLIDNTIDNTQSNNIED